MKRIFYNILFFAIFHNTAISQTPAFEVTVDKSTVAVDEQFRVTYSIEGFRGKSFTSPAFLDFYVLSGPSQSHNIQMINGNFTQSTTYTFVLQAKSEGKFTISPAQVEIEGKAIESKSIIIEVVKSSQQGQASSTQQQGKSKEESSKNDIFLKTSVDKTNVFQGEQITVFFKVYTRIDIVNYTISKNPAFPGFWSQDIELPQQITLSQEIINGVPYQVGTIKQVALFPQKSGKLEIESMQADFVANIKQKRKSSSFDDFFKDSFFNFGIPKTVNVKLTTNTVKINVKPLPEKNKPATFKGTVGKYNLQVSIDKNEIKTNESVTLKIKISGTGNIKLLEPPDLIIPSTIEFYEPKVIDNVSKSALISGSRTFEYLLIPRNEGQHTISGLEFSYFAPDENEYKNILNPDLILNVLKGDIVSGANPSVGYNKEELKLLGEDIRFIKSENVNFIKTVTPLFGTPSFFTLMLSPVFLFLLFLVYRYRYERYSSDAILLKQKKANKVAKKKLTLAMKYLKENNKEHFYNEISKVLWGYAGDKLSITAATLSLEVVREKLTECNVSANSVNNFISTVEYCELARFAPTNNAVDMNNIYNNTIKLISSMENEIKRKK